MRKFLISLFIVVLFSGFVFYLGWTQIKVAPDEVGVVISKTGGIDEELVLPGVLTWKKEFLLPTNAELKTFKIKPLNQVKEVSGELPSASYYSSALGNNDIFSYNFKYSISITVSPESLVELLKLNKITCSEDLCEYLSGAADTIAQIATDYILKKAQENPDFRVESLRRDDLFRGLQIYKEFPEIEISVLSVTSSKIPDFRLYKKLQNKILSEPSVADSLSYEYEQNIEGILMEENDE